MKLRSLIALLVVLSFSVRSQNFEWAKASASGFAEGYGVAVDAAGNVYTTGYFQGTVDFDPGPGSFNLTSVVEQTFIQKLDKHGNFVWAKQFSTNYAGTSIARAIVADSFGHIYLTGEFEYTLDFDPGPGIDSMTGLYGYDIFLEKLDTSGNFIYAKRIGSSGADEAETITTDRFGNIYFGGGFTGTVDFDPGPGVYNLTTSSESPFVAKFDSAGNFVLAKVVCNGAGIVWSLAVDASGYMYTTGTFQGTGDFDPGPGTFNMTASSPSNPSAFISKLDNTGNFVWAKMIGGPVSQCYGYSLVTDDSLNVFVAGYFDYTVDLDPGPGTFTATSMSLTGFFNGYIVKLNAAGNFVWGHQLASPDDIMSMGLSIDKAGNIFDMGFFRGTVDFDPGPGTFNMSSTGGSSINNYLQILDNNGNFINALQISGNNSIQADAIAVDKKRNIYLAGVFSGTYDFDPGPGIYNLAAGTTEELFVQKLSSIVSDSITATACGSYVVGSHTYTTSGTYLDTVSAPAGMDSVLSLILTINAMPVAGAVTGPDTVCGGGSITLSAAITGGAWGSLNTNASVAAGVVSGLTYGTDTVIYMISNDCGTDTTLHPLIVVNCHVGVAEVGGHEDGLHVSPNPGSGLFYVTVNAVGNDPVTVIIADMLGKKVKEFAVIANKEYPVQLDVAAGMYFLNAFCDGKVYTRKLVVIK